jgi:hypothetical protein
MTTELRLTGYLYRDVLADLMRPHPFAAERIGFVCARMGSLAAGGKLILCTRYRSIPDQQYVEDDSVGARIGPEAMTWAMQAAYHGRGSQEGVFHIHLHGDHGETGMSHTDRKEIPPLIPGFQSVGRLAPHGIIILSLSHGTAWVWMPGSDAAAVAGRISIIGAPVEVFERSDSR